MKKSTWSQILRIVLTILTAVAHIARRDLVYGLKKRRPMASPHPLKPLPIPPRKGRVKGEERLGNGLSLTLSEREHKTQK
jgi:hypothetical protein